MLDKNDLLDAILHECDVSLHLYEKIPEGGLEYRPSPPQRNTAELLRYLSYCGIAGARAMVDGNWEGYQEMAARADDMAPEDFPAAMERQKQELTALFETISDEDFANKETTEPSEKTVKLGRALMDLPLLWMVGYRMQLFLYAKAAGNTEIWTPNCWVGIDWERPAST